MSFNLKTTLFLISLGFLNLVAHFLPFERASLAPDDYANFYSWIQNKSLPNFLFSLIHYLNRPFNYLFIFLQGKWTILNPIAGLWFVFLSSSLLLFITYFLFFELFQNQPLAYLASILYCLLPNKLEMYHTAIYANINIVFSIYTLSFLCFLLYLKQAKIRYHILSLTLYTIAVFWYEVGFFLPLIFYCYAFLYEKKLIRKTIHFLIPAGGYLMLHLASFLGWLEDQTTVHSIVTSNIFKNIFFEIPNQFLGFDVLRTIVYAFYHLQNIEFPWMLVLFGADLSLIFYFVFVIQKISWVSLSPKFRTLGALVFIFFLVPNILYYVEPRHTTLSSIGFLLCLIYLLSHLARSYESILKILLIILFIGGLLTSQGTAWNQVIACRINDTLFQTMKKYKSEIFQSKVIIIDRYSFAKNIPYNLKPFEKYPLNLLDFYWGTQAFADWGLSSMVLLATGYKNSSDIVITRNKVVETENFYKVRIRPKLIGLARKEDTFVLNYEKTYPHGFKNGIPTSPPRF